MGGVKNINQQAKRVSKVGGGWQESIENGEGTNEEGKGGKGNGDGNEGGGQQRRQGQQGPWSWQ